MDRNEAHRIYSRELTDEDHEMADALLEEWNLSGDSDTQVTMYGGTSTVHEGVARCWPFFETNIAAGEAALRVALGQQAIGH